jgi:hypothetical protein
MVRSREAASRTMDTGGPLLILRDARKGALLRMRSEGIDDVANYDA